MKGMPGPTGVVVLQVGFFSGITAAVLGVAAGARAFWLCVRRQQGPDQKAKSLYVCLGPYTLVTGTVAVAGSSVLSFVGGLLLKVLRVGVWDLLIKVGSVGGLLAMVLGIGAGVWALWQYVHREPTNTANPG